MLINILIFLVASYASDHVIIKMKPGISINKVTLFNQNLGIGNVIQMFPGGSSYGMNRIYLLYFDWRQKSVEEVLSACQQCDALEYAEPDYVGTGHLLPDDTYFTNQWALHNTGQNPSGQQSGFAGCDIAADSAWDIENGSRDVILAILDTGADLDHPDLIMNPTGTTSVFWKNLGEIPSNGIDDDANGYVDDTLGWNFAYSNNNVQDDHGHGTVNVGISGARGNNSTGVSGVDMYCRIMPVKVLNSGDSGSYSWWANGLYYAANNGARVINMSMGGTSPSATLQTAINYAWSKGCVITVSMGNSNDSTKYYPAYYDSVIATGATDNRDQRCNPSIPGCSWGSCYGSWIDVVAPGYWIYSTVWNNSYQYWSGTSMAAPQVAGTAGLVWALNPTLNNYAVRNIIETTTDDLGSGGFDVYYGYGRINAYKALLATPPIPGWVTEAQLTSTDGLASWEPEIATNGANLHVVFSDQRNSYALYYKRSTDCGLTWRPDTMLSDYQYAYAYYDPAIAVIGNTVLVVFNDNRADSAAIYLKRSTNNGQTWQNDILLSNPAVNSFEPDIAVWQNNVYVVWDQGYRVSTDAGATWQAINSAVHGSAIAAVNGYVHVTYDQGVNDTSQIFYRRFNGSTWESPVQMTTSRGAAWPDIAASGGNVYLIWDEETDNDFWPEDIFARRSTNNGGTWSSAKRLTDAGKGNQGFTLPRIVAQDSAYIAYFGDRDEYFEKEIYIKPSLDYGVSWDHTLRITRDSYYSELPAMAVRGDTLHVVWDNLISSGKEIFYRRKGAVTGIEENDFALEVNGPTIRVYPNPFCGNTDITCRMPVNRYGDDSGTNAENSSTLRIYDAAGRLVKQFNCLPGAAVIHVRWSGRDYAGRAVPVGVYFIELYAAGKKTSSKIVKLD